MKKNQHFLAIISLKMMLIQNGKVESLIFKLDSLEEAKLVDLNNQTNHITWENDRLEEYFAVKNNVTKLD
jgi:hypothetical protein